MKAYALQDIQSQTTIQLYATRKAAKAALTLMRGWPRAKVTTIDVLGSGMRMDICWCIQDGAANLRTDGFVR